MFCALVRPHLEYAQTVWAPHLQKYIDAIKKVQMRATKLVDGIKSLNYEERLEKCGLTTLHFRRLSGDMIQVYKHFHHYSQQSPEQEGGTYTNYIKRKLLMGNEEFSRTASISG